MGEPYYRQAEALLKNSDYSGASAAFKAAGDYRDAAQRVGEPYYLSAEILAERGDYLKAAAQYLLAADYLDAEQKEKQMHYIYAEQLLEQGKLEEADKEFAAAKDYKDAEKRIGKASYERALALFEAKDYLAANLAFIQAKGYADAKERVGEGPYLLAEGLFEAGKYREAADMFLLACPYRDALERGWRIRYGFCHEGRLSSYDNIYGVRTDDTVLMADPYLHDPDWTNVLALDVSWYTRLVIHNDLSVTFVPSLFFSDESRASVQAWDGIVDTGCSQDTAAGLRRDGKVLCAVSRIDKAGLAESVQNSDKLINVIEVECSEDHLVALKSDGTVVALGNNENGQCDVDDWTDIARVNAALGVTIGLKKSGTMIWTVGEYDLSALKDWKDIIAISSSSFHVVGLRADGTVCADAIRDPGERINVNGWDNIVAVSAGRDHTVGLKADGTMVISGSTSDGGFDRSKAILQYHGVGSPMRMDMGRYSK